MRQQRAVRVHVRLWSQWRKTSFLSVFMIFLRYFMTYRLCLFFETLRKLTKNYVILSNHQRILWMTSDFASVEHLVMYVATSSTPLHSWTFKNIVFYCLAMIFTFFLSVYECFLLPFLCWYLRCSTFLPQTKLGVASESVCTAVHLEFPTASNF